MSNGYEQGSIESQFLELQDLMEEFGSPSDKDRLRLDNAEEMMRLLGKGRGGGAPGDDETDTDEETETAAEKKGYGAGATAVAEGVAEEALPGMVSTDWTLDISDSTISADGKPPDTSQQAGTAISEGVAEEADVELSDVLGYDPGELTLAYEDQCEPDFETMYPDKVCEVNFTELGDIESSDYNIGGNEWGLLNKIRESALDSYYENMMIDSGFYSDFDYSELDFSAEYMTRSDVMSIAVLKIDSDVVNYRYAYYTDVSPSGLTGLVSSTDATAISSDISFSFEEDTEDDESDENEGISSVTYNYPGEVEGLQERFGSTHTAEELVQTAYSTILNGINLGSANKNKFNRIRNDVYKFGVFSTLGSLSQGGSVTTTDTASAGITQTVSTTTTSEY